MRRTTVLVSMLLLVTANLTWAQTEPPAPGTAPATPTVAAKPMPEPLELPDPVGEWWTAVRQLVARYGWRAAIGAILVLVPLYLLLKVGEEVAEEEAKGLAARVRQGAQVTWYRVTRRMTPEEEAFVKHVRTTCERLELKGFVKEQLIIVSLESVYVPLTTQGASGIAGGRLTEAMELLRAAGQAGAVPLTDLLARHRQLVLVGEGGSGKTTFLKYVALAAARARAGRGSDGVEWLRESPPLPLFLPLHGLGVFLSDQKAADREWPNPDLLHDYVVHHLRHLALPEGWFAKQLEAGNVLILLDGLDEVARFEDRRFIAELVTRFAAFYDGCQTIVTTRPQGYEGAAQLGGDFERRDVNPLQWPEDIQTFLYRWNEAIWSRAAGGTPSAHDQREARDNARDLMARLDVAEDVRELANNPLLLTVMAIVHYNVGSLPERRADLHNAATELLLGWDQRMGRGLQAPPPWLDALTAAQRRVPVEELALDFQERRDLARPRAEVAAFFADHFLAGSGPEAEAAARVRAEEYLSWVAQRTSVLQEISGTIRFYRKPFQEYLAARRLARHPDLQARVAEILGEDWRDRWWDETLLLTVGHLITEDPPRANALLAAILGLDDPAEAPHYNATCVARALADVPEGLLGSVWEVKERAAQELAGAVAGVEPAFGAAARLEAGVALGALGDPRPGTGAVRAGPDQPSLPDLVWVPVEGGPFVMGSSDDEAERWKVWVRERVEDGTLVEERYTSDQLLEFYSAWLEGERGRHEVEVHGFWMTRYLVTNAQYRCFVEAGGYDDVAWWGGEESPAWAWRQSKPRADWRRTDRPDFWHDPRFNGPNQPVVGVTWYEAMAFCRWLTARLKGWGGGLQVWRDGEIEVVNVAPESLAVRLPTEAEWEKAVRGTDGRTWPWGDAWDAARANTADSHLGQTSPVGIFPGGDSPYGVADGAGNVWEVTSSLWGRDWRRPDLGYPYRPDDGREDASPGDQMARVVRGGSWDSIPSDARCAVRNGLFPNLSYRFYGFRCVSPVSLV